MVNKHCGNYLLKGLTGVFTLQTALIDDRWGYDYSVYRDGAGNYYMDASDGSDEVEVLPTYEGADMDEIRETAWALLLGKALPSEVKFEVFEDNAGGLALAILDADGKCVYFHTGYEYTSNGLLIDIATLNWDGYAPEDWENNCDGMEGVTPAQLYNDWQDSSTCLVADNNGVYRRLMGCNAREAFHFDKIPVEDWRP